MEISPKIVFVCRADRNCRVPELEEELKDQSEVAQKEKRRADELQAIQDKEEAQTELVRKNKRREDERAHHLPTLVIAVQSCTWQVLLVQIDGGLDYTVVWR